MAEWDELPEVNLHMDRVHTRKVTLNTQKSWARRQGAGAGKAQKNGLPGFLDRADARLRRFD